MTNGPSPSARPVSGRSRYLLADARPTARLRLFCFHHAGGAASAFRGWAEALPADVAVVPVQLPGRETRAAEPRVREMTALVAELDRELDPLLQAPHMFYGHSMGALVAHALTRRRWDRQATVPDRLLVGASRAPHLPVVLADGVSMSDGELARLLVDIGGMSATMLRYPDWMGSAVALVRDDLSLCSSNPYRDPVRLPCPVEVFAGRADPLVSLADAHQWAAHTTADLVRHEYPGGHFFPRDCKDRFLPDLRKALRHSTPPKPAPAATQD